MRHCACGGALNGQIALFPEILRAFEAGWGRQGGRLPTWGELPWPDTLGQGCWEAGRAAGVAGWPERIARARKKKQVISESLGEISEFR